MINFVAQNTREGRVLQKLLDRLAEIRKDLGTDQVFDVVGEVFPSNLLEQLIRKMYLRETDEREIQDRIVKEVSPERFRAITESALEGLAKRELNLSAIIGKSAEAKERRLVPEVVEQFFHGSRSPDRPAAQADRQGRPRVPRRKTASPACPDRRPAGGPLWAAGTEYAQIAFDKAYLTKDPTLEWVTTRPCPVRGGPS